MGKIKLFLLGGIFAFLGIFTFTSAETLSISCVDNQCSPSTITIDSSYCVDGVPHNINLDFSSVSCVDGPGFCTIEDASVLFSSADGIFNISSSDSTLNFCEVYEEGPHVFEIDSMEYNYNISVSMGGGDDSGNTGGGTGGGDDTGGNDNSLISSFTPVLTGLANTIIEFIPYVVYVLIGVISALLGFVAIKWLINWLRRKVLSPFK